MTVLESALDTNSGSTAARVTLLTLYFEGAGSAETAAATKISQGRIRAIRAGVRAASIDEACRIVGYAAFLNELAENHFPGLSEALSWVEVPIDADAGCYLRPVDLIADDDLELVEDLARARASSSETVRILDATNRDWYSDYEVFADTDGHRSIRIRG